MNSLYPAIPLFNEIENSTLHSLNVITYYLFQEVVNMNRQQVGHQIDYVRRELTRISQELLYLEGAQAQSMRVRQSRLAGELERLQALQLSGSLSIALPALPDIPLSVDTHN